MHGTPTGRQITPWRQGHVLPSEAIADLGLIDEKRDGSLCAVVLSHDCDLALRPDVEPFVEIAIGCWVDKPNGSLRWAKSLRRLHLDALNAGSPAVLEVTAVKRQQVRKEELLYRFLPDTGVSIDGENLRTLQRWLALRYSRSSFEDEFVNRMADCDDSLTKLMNRKGHCITAVCLNVDRGENIDRVGDGSAYELDVVLLYSPSNDGEAASAVAQELADEISSLFEQTYFDKEKGWRGIQLTDCFPVSEEEMNVGQYRRLKEWRLEHVSLRGQDKHAEAAAAAG